MISNAINGVTSMFLVIVLGYFIAGTALFQNNNGTVMISKYLTHFALPIYMVYNTTSLFASRSNLLGIRNILFIPFLLVIIGMAVGFFLVKIFRIEAHKQGIFMNACGLSNTVFLGFPIVQAILGERVIPVAMTYYMANTFLFWTLGTFFLSRDNRRETDPFTKQTLKKIFSLPLIGFLVGLILVMMNFTIPQFLISAMETVSKTSPGLGMVFIGAIIRETKLSERSYLKDVGILFLSKLILLPSVILGVLILLPIPLEKKQIFFIMTTMPGMTQLGLMSKELGSDYKFASTWVAFSTMTSVFTVPLQVWLMTILLK